MTIYIVARNQTWNRELIQPDLDKIRDHHELPNYDLHFLRILENNWDKFKA